MKLKKKASSSLSYKRNYKAKLFIIALACFSFVVVFAYVPLFGWSYAFFDYKPGLKLFDCEFVGLKFFKLAVNHHEILTVLTNTLAIGFLGILVSPLPAVFAILLSQMRSKRYRSIIQTTTTLPYFVSWVLVYAVFFAFLSPEGFINQLLLRFNLISDPIDPLTNVKITWYLQTGIGIWKNLGFSAIIYLATIVSIDQQLFDAANVDGANRWQTIIHIVVPSLIPTYLNLLILGVGFILSNGFEQYYLFYNPLVHSKIQVLDLFLYRVGLMRGDFPLSTALGMSKSLISITLLFTVNLISKRLRGHSII